MTELSVALAIVALVAAILFPVLSRAQTQAHRTACISNLRQIGMAFQQYVQDNDEQHLVERPAWYDGDVVNTGWVRVLSPYLREHSLLRCPTDQTTAPEGGSLRIVSYGINSNFAQMPLDAAAGATSRTVFAFEITQCLVAAAGERNARPTAISGDGVTLLGDPDPFVEKSGARYATGPLDNRAYKDPHDVMILLFRPAPRHVRGANYLTADSHAVWATPDAVSAGQNAEDARLPQNSHGYAIPDRPDLPKWPTAEGTGFYQHKLTFSVR